MEITYLGHASFKIRTYIPQVGWVTVVTDPYDPEMVGLKFPKTSADIVTISHEHQDHNASDEVRDGGPSPKVLRGPGEYEIKGVTIRGVATMHDEKNGAERGENTVFVFDSEGLRIAHLGDLGQKLTDSQLSEIGTVDIVMVPTGGRYTIDADMASEVVGQLEPKVIIPMHYKVPGMKPSFDNLLSVEDFVKKMGIEPKNLDKYETKKGLRSASTSDGSTGEEMELVVLERKP